MTAVSLQRMQQSGTLGQIFWPAALQGFGAVPSDAGDGTIRFGRIRWFFRAATTQPDCLPQDAREQCEPLGVHAAVLQACKACPNCCIIRKAPVRFCSQSRAQPAWRMRSACQALCDCTNCRCGHPLCKVLRMRKLRYTSTSCTRENCPSPAVREQQQRLEFA